MKKKIIIIMAIISISIMVIVGMVLFKESDKADKIIKNPDYNLKEYPIDELPTFTFVIVGNKMRPIKMTKEKLKNRHIKAYEFSKDINNNWETVTNDYIGIRLKDILDDYKFNYNDIEIREVDKYSTRFTKDKIDDDIFIIFYRDNKKLGNIEPISLVSFNDPWDKSLTDFNYIFLYQEDSSIDISVTDNNALDESDINDSLED